MKRAITLFLALALALSLAPAASLAGSDAYGSEVWLRDTVIQDGVTYSDNTFWSGTYQGPRHEYYFTYTPGSVVRPVAALGPSVCGRLTTSAAVREYESRGYRVVGAINGDFFDFSTGCPLGIAVSGGELLSGSDWTVGIHPDGADHYYAVGFRADGSVVMGEPKLSITARAGFSGASIPLASINRPQGETYYANLITYDYRSDHTTGTLVSGFTVLATVESGMAAIGGELRVRVTQLAAGDAPLTLREDQVALSVAAGGNADALRFIQSLALGETVSISFASPNPEWNQVVEAIGAKDLLVSDGVAQGGFDATAAPRTAVGLKANGELILYTIDGRQNSVSVGTTLNVLAKRMVELGCVTALNLDGGGSTTAVAALPGRESAQVLNSPSDGSERQDPNHILLVIPAQPTNIPGGAYLSVPAPAVLAGGTLPVTAGAMDAFYFPMSGSVDLYASGGSVADGVFTAPAQSGDVTITASFGFRDTQVKVQVIDAPDAASLLRDGKALSSLTLQPGETVQLGISASYRHQALTAGFSDFTWSLDPALGSIDSGGVLTAGYTGGKGTLTASRGGFSVSIPVTVDLKVPFVDINGHWSAANVASMYHLGVLTGVPADGVLYAYPDRGVTREEFATMLARYLKLDMASYAEYAAPFADMDHVSAWARDSVRAMYTLGVVNGIASDGGLLFDPQGGLSRAQAVTMLGRMAAYQGTSQADADLAQFTDTETVPDYALEHFRTLVAIGVVNGSNGRLDPHGAMTRGQICKVLDTMP